jgi:stress-induced morphogen
MPKNNLPFECSKGNPSFPPSGHLFDSESIYQFSHSSSIQIFDANQKFKIEQISIKFATRKPVKKHKFIYNLFEKYLQKALLIYWPIEGNKFISVDLINGKIRLNYFGNSLESNLLGETVNDGSGSKLIN